MNLSFNGKGRPTQRKERRLACLPSPPTPPKQLRRWIGEGGAAAETENLKSTAGKSSFL